MESAQASYAAKPKKPLYKDLLFQVVVAVVAGVLLGYFYPELGVAQKPWGDAFIKLIKMIIAPVIFCTIVTGVAGMGNMKQAGRVGGKALLYFEVVTTLALIIGLISVNVLKPGSGMNIDPATLDTKDVAKYIDSSKEAESTVDFFMHLIPSTITDAFAKGDILQVLVVSLFFAFALSAMGEKGKPLVSLIDVFSKALFKIIDYIMIVAPLAAFGAMAFTIGKYGIGTLVDLATLVGVFYATCAFFVFAVLGIVTRICGISIWQFLKFIKEEMIIILGTSSSESVLPRMLDKMAKLGCSKPVVDMVIPTGYSFNLDGTSIYLTLAAVFIAQATNTPLTLWDELTLIGILLLTSKGASGVTGAGFIVLAATLASVGNVPVAGLALIFGVDRFMSTGRAITNLIGNGIATIVVAKWENAFDAEHARKVLSGEIKITPTSDH